MTTTQEFNATAALAKALAPITYDIDTSRLGDGNSWSPYLTVEMTENGEVEVTVSDSPVDVLASQGYIFTHIEMFDFCEMQTDEDRVKAFVEREIAPVLLQILDAHNEGAGSVEYYREKLGDVLSNWSAWADDVSDEAED